MLALASGVALFAVLVATAVGYTRNVNSFGSTGSEKGQMRLPGGVAVSPDGTRVYVADTENQRIDEFTADGREFIRAWGWGVADGTSELQTCRAQNEEEAENGEGGERNCFKGQAGQGAGQLNEPIAIAVAEDGTVYVVNRAKGDGRVEAFDPSEEEVTYEGALPAGYGRTGEGEVSFTYPLPYTEDIEIGPDGRIYVGDQKPSGAVLHIFDPATGTNEEVALPGLEPLVAFTPVAAEDPEAEELFWATSRYGTPSLYRRAAGEAEAEVVAHAEGEGSFSALAVDAESGVLYAESSEYKGEEKALVEYDAKTGRRLGQIAVTGEAPSYEEPSAYGLALNPHFTYESEYEASEEGVIYVVNRFGNYVNILAEAVPGKPVVERNPAESVSSTGATLFGRVNPEGFDTHAYFEYGTTSAYGQTSPAPPGVDLGEGFLDKPVSTHLYGLQPDTTYHYALVATNDEGAVASADATFTTYPAGGPSPLPDGRAYEQVSTEKGTANVEGLFAAPGGNGVAFTSAGPLPGSASGSLFTAYTALRSPAGWQSYSASTPVEDALGVNQAISPDLRQSIGFSSRNVTGDAPPGSNLYLRDNITGAETLMTPYTRGSNTNYETVGFSSDFSRFFFESPSDLTPDTPETEAPNEYRQSLYEWHAGTLRNVGILPGATTPTPRSIASAGSFSALHPVSEDGSEVFFLAEPAPLEKEKTSADQLFVRIGGTRTIEVSAPAPGVEAEPRPGVNATFVGAAADGSAAFFESEAELTPDANTGPAGERKPNLYRYDVKGETLTDLSVTGEAEGAAVSGVLVAGDGDSAYFVARGVLAPGGQAGRPNLYRWSQGVGVRFVATLNEGDQFTNNGAAANFARTTDDGSVLAFTSGTPLDPRFPGAESTAEIYRYSAADGSLVCVSCARAGSGSQSSAEITAANTLSGGYGGNVLSEDGNRVFFQTAAALVPQDTNGKIDVYEWEGGSAHLISSGTGDNESNLIDASRSGGDVFFVTENRLVPGDQDGYNDVYDAKVEGGLPGPSTTVPCEAQGCRSSAAESAPGAIGSSTFHGPGDKKAKHHRKKHHKRKKHHAKKHRKHAKHGKQKRSHGHPAVGKRG